MLPLREIAEHMTHGLRLARPPLGLAFLKEPPAGVPRFGEAAPSACAFWKAAETSLFYSTPEDHFNCPIGALTQGFDVPRDVMDRALTLIEQMGKLEYLDAVEASNVPRVARDHRVVVYGPLGAFGEIAPDVALLVCTPFQAMLVAEAAGIVAWSPAPTAKSLGRPACAVIPAALSSGQATLSMGCMGARTFADIGENELLVAVPAASLGSMDRNLQTILGANASMKDHYTAHKCQITEQGR